MTIEERLQQAREAVEALQAEYFIAQENGFGPRERDDYHASQWQKLREAVTAREFCSACGTHYAGEHQCEEWSDLDDTFVEF